MTKRSSWLVVLLFASIGCGGSGDGAEPDGPGGCDPATILPGGYRLIPAVSTGAVSVTTASGVTSGTIDATAGGINNSADNPYVYVDLRTSMKVAINDVEARSSTNWDIALKRSSLRTNSGDSGPGNREVAAVQAATLAEVTAAPTSGYAQDDFATADCTLDSTIIGEPRSAFGDWYNYDEDTHVVTPKAEVYVLQRNNGSRTAFRIKAFYDPASPMRGALYSVEWKQL
jgi:hypothetical protein